MALNPLRTKVDRRAGGSELAITGEAHTIGEDTTDFVFLDEVPLKSASVTVNGTPAGGGSFTEVTTGSPAAGEYKVDFAGRLAGAIEFNSADADIDVTVDYTGRGSALFARDVNRIHDRIVAPPVTIADGDATPSVKNAVNLVTANTGATTITDLDDGANGQRVVVFFNDANTTVRFSGANLYGNDEKDWSPQVGDSMECVYDGTNWWCRTSLNEESVTQHEAALAIAQSQLTGGANGQYIRHQSGAPAWTDELIDKGGAVYNVKHPEDFGAVGDGTTDDTAAIQAAIDAAEAAGGGLVFFPPGDYLVSSTITVDGASFTLDGSHTGRLMLKGVGRSGSRIKAASSWTPGDIMFQFTGTSGTQIKEMVVSDLWLDGAGEDVDLMKLEWVTRSCFERLLLKNTVGHGVHVEDGYDLNWDTCYWDQCGGDGSHYGFFAEGTDATSDVNNVRFFACRWENFGTKPGGTFLKVDGSGMLDGTARKWVWVGCKFHGEQTAGNRAARPHIVINGLAFGSFVAPTEMVFSKGATAFFDLTDVGSFQFIGGGYSGNSDNDYFWSLVNCDNIAIDAVAGFVVNTSYINAVSGNSSLKVGLTCTWGGSTDVVTGQTDKAWVGESVDDELNVSGEIVYSGRVSSTIKAVPDGDATPSVFGANILQTGNTAPTTITALDVGATGQTVTVLFGDGNTTIDFTGTTLKGNGGADWSPANGDHMTCVYDGTNWYCDISDNTA